MKDRMDEISTVVAFARHLLEPRKCAFLAFEGLITGGIIWRVRAWFAERALLRRTKKQYEASGEEFEKCYEVWQALSDTAKLGTVLKQSEDLKATVDRLKAAGVCEPRLRTWIINHHLGADGQLRTRDWTEIDRLTHALGWAWHTLVAITATLFLALAWALPGSLLITLAVTVFLVFYFLLMSALMNSVSLSRLPPPEVFATV